MSNTTWSSECSFDIVGTLKTRRLTVYPSLAGSVGQSPMHPTQWRTMRGLKVYPGSDDRFAASSGMQISLVSGYTRFSSNISKVTWPPALIQRPPLVYRVPEFGALHQITTSSLMRVVVPMWKATVQVATAVLRGVSSRVTSKGSYIRVSSTKRVQKALVMYNPAPGMTSEYSTYVGGPMGSWQWMFDPGGAPDPASSVPTSVTQSVTSM